MILMHRPAPEGGSALPSGTIWSALPVPAFLIDTSECIADANPAAEQFINASARAIRGTPAFDRLMIDAPMEEALARVRGNHAALFINDVDVGTGERPPVQCNIQIAPLSDTSGTVLLLIAPREIAGRLGRMCSAKPGARSAIGMAEMLAHEIKNPLAGITGAAQLLSMGLSPGDRELTDLIVEESRRIVKLLEQVEQFGNLRPSALRPVNIHDVLERARQSAQLGFASHMRFTENYDPSLPPALADSDQLLQVFLNLFKNAAEVADGSGGTILLHSYFDQALRLRRPDGSGSALPLQIEIIDDGPGLPPDIADDIFEPFVSGRENGTGLGLALVSRIINDHGGLIAVDSSPGRTVFRLSLPVAAGASDPEPQAHRSPTQQGD